MNENYSGVQQGEMESPFKVQSWLGSGPSKRSENNSGNPRQFIATERFYLVDFSSEFVLQNGYL